MKEKNISQKKLVLQSNIPKSSISDYITGKYFPKRDNIIKLASVLNVNPDWLEGQDVPKRIEFSYVNYDNIDSVAKYYDYVISTNKDALDDNMVSMIAHILKTNSVIDNIDDFTKKSKKEIVKFINDNKNVLNDKRILIDIKNIDK